MTTRRTPLKGSRGASYGAVPSQVGVDNDEVTEFGRRRTYTSAVRVLAIGACCGVGFFFSPMKRAVSDRLGIAQVYKVTAEAKFTLDVGCIEGIEGRFFENGGRVTGARIVRHNLHSSNFFDFTDGIVMREDTAANEGAHQRKFSVTTDQVDFEYGFALTNQRGEHLYEIGKSTSPLAKAYASDDNTECIQQYGGYFNRVRTMDKTPEVVDWQFGKCAKECPAPKPPPPAPEPPTPPPPVPEPPTSPPPPWETGYFKREGYGVAANFATGACAEERVFESTDLKVELAACEKQCSECDDCVGYVHTGGQTCTFHASDGIEQVPGDDWYSRHSETPVPAPTPVDSQTDTSLGMDDESIAVSDDPCASCSVKFYAGCAPGYTTPHPCQIVGTYGDPLATLTTVSSHENPEWTNIPFGTSALVIEGSDNCRVITDADDCYDFMKKGGRSSTSTTDGVYNYPMPTGNDNINKAYLHCASADDVQNEASSVTCKTVSACSECQVTFYQHWAPGHGDTGATLATITMDKITTDTSNPVWVSMQPGQMSSAVMTGEEACRFKTDRDSTYEYARGGSSGGGAAGVYNFPMPSGNDVVTKAYMWCAATKPSREFTAPST